MRERTHSEHVEQGGCVSSDLRKDTLDICLFVDISFRHCAVRVCDIPSTGDEARPTLNAPEVDQTSMPDDIPESNGQQSQQSAAAARVQDLLQHETP